MDGSPEKKPVEADSGSVPHKSTKFMRPGKLPKAAENPARAKTMIPTVPEDKTRYTTALRVEDLIGDGSFGRVFSAVLIQTDSRTARKENHLANRDEKPLIYLDSKEFGSLQETELGIIFSTFGFFCQKTTLSI